MVIYGVDNLIIYIKHSTVFKCPKQVISYKTNYKSLKWLYTIVKCHTSVCTREL